MKLKNVIQRVISILSVVLIVLAIGVTALIFATNNGYAEPIFGDTMLLSVRDDSTEGVRAGALAIVDLSTGAKGDYYAAFVGGGVRITKDSMAHIGTVKHFIPLLGAVMDFFRSALIFFLLIVLPLVAMVIWYIIRIVLIVQADRTQKIIAGNSTHNPGISDTLKTPTADIVENDMAHTDTTREVNTPDDKISGGDMR